MLNTCTNLTGETIKAVLCSVLPATEISYYKTRGEAIGLAEGN